MSIGKVIKEYRKKHELSLREFAEMCKLSHAYIDKLENGKDPITGKDVTPTMRTIELISNAMGLKKEDFMRMAGYISDDNLSKESIPPKSKKIYDVIARAKDLPDQNLDEITDTLDALIDVHLKRLKNKKK